MSGSRDSSARAAILRVRDSGSGHRLVTLLTAEEGLIEAFMYGGPKSRLRSLAAPYHEGRAWLYRDPVRDSWKLSDFDPVDFHEGARSGLSRSMHASLWAEVLIRTRASGSDFHRALDLVSLCLGALDSLKEPEAAYASLVFAWELAGLMGLRPDGDSCASCSGAIAWDGIEWYAMDEGAFICRSCRESRGEGGRGGLVAVPPGVGRYVAACARLAPAEALRLRLDAAGLGTAKRLAWALLRRLAEGELNVLSMGEGIL